MATDIRSIRYWLENEADYNEVLDIYERAEDRYEQLRKEIDERDRND